LADLTKAQQYSARWASLKNERASWIAHWKDISDYMLPRSGRFFVTDRNRGEKRANNIYDSTATRALRILAAGMMAGMTSPARPWFRLATGDPDKMDNGAVKIWLNDVTMLMRAIFQRSNTYRALHSLYEELGCYGTGASIIVDDYEDVIRHIPLTAGEYAIATDERGEVVTLYREFEQTVSQLVKEFGIAGVSPAVKSLYEQKSGSGLDAWVPIIHAIEPRYDRDPTKRDAKNMAWASCYFETGRVNDDVLRESGFKEFPSLCPRWAVSGGDIYGNGPGMEALGDVKQLQHQQLRKAQGIDYMTKPPVQAPTAMKNSEINMLPGGVSYVDASSPSGGIRSAFDVRIDLSHLLNDIQDVRQRIEKTFYADLFLMLANDTRSGITATEVAERHEEKLLMLGPVLERLNNEMLAPKIEITFAKMLAAGIIPQAPPELHGEDLNIEFVSTLAQAQRAVGTTAVDRLVSAVGQLAVAKQDPSVWDKLDTDEITDEYGDMLGVDPHMIVASDKVALIRQNRAQAQQKAAQQQALAQHAQTAQTLSQTDTSGKNALTDVMGGMQGYG
jgi:hypothetical protein